MILMAEENGIGGGKVIKGRPPQKGWGGVPGLKVWRNLYGSALSSDSPTWLDLSSLPLLIHIIKRNHFLRMRSTV